MMKRTICVALIAAFCLPLAARAALAPERAVELDFAWLAAPEVSPASATASLVRMNGHVRISSRDSEEGAHLRWPLRYPVDLSQYPVVVLRYRSATMDAHADRPVLSLLQRGDGGVVNVVRAGDLTQDSYLHEYRREVAQVGVIDGFVFSLPPGMLRLDIVELRFEAAAGKPVTAGVRQQVQFVVRDDAGTPASRAVVRVGPLERANWTASVVTGEDGLAVATAAVPTEPGTPRTVAIEAAIQGEGLRPQYIAEVDASAGETFLAQVDRVAVARTPAPISVIPPEPMEAPEVAQVGPPQYPTYNETIINNYYDDRYYPDYGYRYGYDRRRGYGFGGFYPGVVIVRPPKDDDGNGDGDGDGNGNGNGNGNGDGHSIPGLPPPNHVFPGPVPRHEMASNPVGGVVGAPTEGLTTAPRYGVTTSPRYGVVASPSYGVTTAPGIGVTTAPGFGVVPAPSGRLGQVESPEPGTQTNRGIEIPSRRLDSRIDSRSRAESPRRMEAPGRAAWRMREPSRMSEPSRMTEPSVRSVSPAPRSAPEPRVAPPVRSSTPSSSPGSSMQGVRVPQPMR